MLEWVSSLALQCQTLRPWPSCRTKIICLEVFIGLRIVFWEYPWAHPVSYSAHFSGILAALHCFPLKWRGRVVGKLLIPVHSTGLSWPGQAPSRPWDCWRGTQLHLSGVDIRYVTSPRLCMAHSKSAWWIWLADCVQNPNFLTVNVCWHT